MNEHGGSRVSMRDGAHLATATTHRAVDRATTPVLLLHGGPGLWDYLGPVDDLLDQASTVHRYDQRGCGRSSPSRDLTMARYVADIEELRRHWAHEQMVLIGHSFGAALALAYAGTHPERASAVGYLSGVGIGDWHTPYRAEVARRRAAAGLHERLTELDGRRRTWSEEVEWRRLTWATDYADTAAGLSAADEMARTPLSINHVANRRLTFTDADQLRWAGAVTCPVFFIHGTADPRPSSPVSALAQRTPGAHVHLIDGAGHLPWAERSEETRHALHTVVAAG